MRLLSTVSLLLVLASTAPAQAPAATAPAATAPAFTGVDISLLLNGDLSSRDVKEGHKIKAYVRKDTTLPTGEVLPVHAALTGRVLKVSKSSKDKPNGILELIFDTAVTRKGEPFPVTVKIKEVNPPGADETGGPSVEKKPKKGAEKKSAEPDAKPKVPNQTGIPGVFLQVPADGSAILYTPGDDVEVSDSVQMTALIARATP